MYGLQYALIYSVGNISGGTVAIVKSPAPMVTHINPVVSFFDTTVLMYCFFCPAACHQTASAMSAEEISSKQRLAFVATTYGALVFLFTGSFFENLLYAEEQLIRHDLKFFNSFRTRIASYHKSAINLIFQDSEDIAGMEP